MHIVGIIVAQMKHVLGVFAPICRGRPLADRLRRSVRDDRNANAQLQGNAEDDQLVGILSGGEPLHPTHVHVLGARRASAVQSCKGVVDSGLHVIPEQHCSLAPAESCAEAFRHHAQRRAPMISTDTRSQALSAKVCHGLMRVRDAWQSLGQNVRRAFGQADSETQPEARARGPARILAEVENQRFEVELIACPLGILCCDFVISQPGPIWVPDTLR